MKIQRSIILVLTLILGSVLSAAQAATITEHFSGKSDGSFQRVHADFDIESKKVYYRSGHVWRFNGFVGMASHWYGNAAKGGAYWANKNTTLKKNHAVVEARVAMYGEDARKKHNWGAWWVSNLLLNDQSVYELDIMETPYSYGNSFNTFYKWATSGGSFPTGNSYVPPNSNWWRNSYHNYKVDYRFPGVVYFRFNNQPKHTFYLPKGEQFNNNRPMWPLFNNRPSIIQKVRQGINIPVGKYPDYYADWMKMTF